MLPTSILQTDKIDNCKCGSSSNSVSNRQLDLFGSKPERQRVRPDKSSRDAEDRQIVIITLWYLVLMLLPAFSMMIYLIFNPDAFMYDVTPQIDFSNWQPGQRPEYR